MQNLFSLKFHVSPLDGQECVLRVQRALLSLDQAVRVDINKEKSIGRIVSKQIYSIDQLRQALTPLGFILSPVEKQASKKEYLFSLSLEGMTCRSCEVLIEERWKKSEGIVRVQAHASKNRVHVVSKNPSLDMKLLQEKIAEAGYRIKGLHKNETSVHKKERLSFVRLAGLFCLVFGLALIASRLNILKPGIALGQQLSVVSAFFLGLVAATSSCVAVSGGVLLSALTQYKKRAEAAGKTGSLHIPIISFVGGRIISYGLFGAVIGLIGKSLAVSPLVTGGLTLAAALYMIVMGLDILDLVPGWLKQAMPRMPKRISGLILRYEEHQHPVVPFLLGAGTFFLPCGFTQSLQLYALTTGNALTSGLLLFVFALGTAPALLVLGYASHSLKGKLGTFFYQFSGALVVMLGIWNIGNGLAVAGFSLPNVASIGNILTVSLPQSNMPQESLVPYDGKEQVMTMAVQDAGYSPNKFVVRKGVPTRWVIDAQDSGGCLSVLVAQKLGVQKLLAKGENVIEFTPMEIGSIPFSCSMGMYRGTINVVAS